MYQFGNLLEELEVLEKMRRKAEDAYFENEDNHAIVYQRDGSFDILLIVNERTVR